MEGRKICEVATESIDNSSWRNYHVFSGGKTYLIDFPLENFHTDAEQPQPFELQIYFQWFIMSKYE